jgi:hypothetical protein
LAAGTVEVGDVVENLDEAFSLVGTEVGRVVAEVAVVGEAGSAGWIDVDAADTRRRAANFIRLETRVSIIQTLSHYYLASFYFINV